MGVAAGVSTPIAPAVNCHTVTNTRGLRIPAELVCAALEMSSYGWPILCGTYLDDGQWRGRPDAVDLRPVDEDWQNAWTSSHHQVAEWWSAEPYSLLLACGNGVDCLLVPATTGPRVLSALRSAGVHPPAMLTPNHTLALLVLTDTPGRPHQVLVSASVRSAGTWIALPPTRIDGRLHAGAYRWVPGASPRDVRGQLPELSAVYEVIVATVSRTSSATDMVDEPPR